MVEMSFIFDPIFFLFYIVGVILFRLINDDCEWVFMLGVYVIICFFLKFGLILELFICPFYKFIENNFLIENLLVSLAKSVFEFRHGVIDLLLSHSLVDAFVFGESLIYRNQGIGDVYIIYGSLVAVEDFPVGEGLILCISELGLRKKSMSLRRF